MRTVDRFQYFILASLGAHIVLFAGLLATQFSAPEKSNDSVEISLLTDEELQALQNPSAEENLKQIVETLPDQANKQVSESAKYLSAQDHAVEKETRAQYAEQFRNAQKSPAASQAPARASAQQKSKLQKKTAPQLFDEGFNAYEALNEQQSLKQMRQLAAAGGDSSSTNDNLPDVDESLMTQLNTREYKYYSYYSRIKNQLNQWWVPAVQQEFAALVKQGRTIASEESKVTKLIIVLNDKGLLVNVKVLAESGVRELDKAAVDAFRSAAPFPNPPRGMIEADGTVQIRWDCVVES